MDYAQVRHLGFSNLSKVTLKLVQYPWGIYGRIIVTSSSIMTGKKWVEEQHTLAAQGPYAISPNLSFSSGLVGGTYKMCNHGYKNARLMGRFCLPGWITHISLYIIKQIKQMRHLGAGILHLGWPKIWPRPWMTLLMKPIDLQGVKIVPKKIRKKICNVAYRDGQITPDCVTRPWLDEQRHHLVGLSNFGMP